MILNRTDDEEGLRLPSAATRESRSCPWIGCYKLICYQDCLGMTGLFWRQQNLLK